MTEIEMPPRVVLGDAWSNPTLQDVPGRVDLEAALRGDGVPLSQAHLVFMELPNEDDENHLVRQSTEVAHWVHLADGSVQLSAAHKRGKTNSCSALKLGQSPLSEPELRLYSPPTDESSILVQEAFSRSPIFAMGPTATGAGAVYAALSPGDQVTVIQAFSPEGKFGELIRVDRGNTAVQLIRGDDEATLCTIQAED